MKWCERCGGPLRRDGDVGPTIGGCRLCWLADEDAEAQDWSPGDGRLAAWVEWADQPVLANSPCPHASGWWLPEGAREALRTSIPHGNKDMDRVALEDWLARRSIYLR